MLNGGSLVVTVDTCLESGWVDTAACPQMCVINKNYSLDTMLVIGRTNRNTLCVMQWSRRGSHFTSTERWSCSQQPAAAKATPPLPSDPLSLPPSPQSLALIPIHYNDKPVTCSVHNDFTSVMLHNCRRGSGNWSHQRSCTVLDLISAEICDHVQSNQPSSTTQPWVVILCGLRVKVGMVTVVGGR